MTVNLAQTLCRAFCDGIEVHPVPSGYAVSAPFIDASGDPISFYISETDDGLILEDDGDFLASLIARDLPIDVGSRARLLDAILAEGDASWDRDTYEIRSPEFHPSEVGSRSIAFLSSLIRARDLAHITKEHVRSAFRDDFIAAVRERFGDAVEIDENVPPDDRLVEFPADVVIRPKSTAGRVGAIYLVNNNDKLNEALLAWRELEDAGSDIALLAVVETMKNISDKRFQRAQNRGLPMPIFRGDEGHAMGLVSRQLRLVA